MIGDFIIDSLRKLFFAIDKVVFGLIGDVYGLLLQLTRTSIFTQDIINEFAQRIYAVVGIFMLFKVSVSLINYVLNPEDFSNEEKGFTSIIKHVLISLALIVLVPYIFNEAYELQAIILEENTIMNLVFGSPDKRNVANSTYTESAGEKIQFTIMYAFAQPNYKEFSHDGRYDLIDCKKTYETNSDRSYKFRKKAKFDGIDTSGESAYIYELRQSCWGVYNPETDMYTDDGTKGQLYLAFANGIKGGKDATAGDIIYQNYAQGVAQQSFDLFFKQNVMMAKVEDGRYLVDYKFLISTAVGIGTLYLLLVFCVDVAVRSVKLGFLQMIAPIPILSYCDPKSGKDGMFSKWVNTCKNTYIELFTRLFALYFGIYVISLISTFRDVTTGDIVDNWIVSIFMIIGILIFVKQLPKIIEETLGIKASGTFQPNLLKKLENDAVGGKVLASASKKTLGVAGGVATGALAAGADLLTGQGVHRKAFTNAIKGGWNGEKFGKNFASSYGAGRARHKQLQEMAADGVHRQDIFKENFRNTVFGGRTKAEKVSNLENQAKAIQSYYDQIKGQAVGCDANDSNTFVGSSGRVIRSAKTISRELEEIKKTQVNRNDYASEAAYQAAISDQKNRISQAEKDLEERINWLSQGHDTGVASANKVIKEATSSIQALKKSSNDLGRSLDPDFVTITNTDVVGIMKQAKGTAAQASSGEMAKIKDVAKYTNQGQKK